MTDITSTSAWKNLEKLHAEKSQTTLRDLFAADSNRATNLTFEAAGLHVDMSKQLIDASVLDALTALVGDADFAAPAMVEHRLQGEALRFKMLAILAAYRLVVAAQPSRNPGMSRGWSLYRRALRGTLAAIDGPLESLTAALGARQGLVEFKKALEVLLDL